jgi:hypothetical protein
MGRAQRANPQKRTIVPKNNPGDIVIVQVGTGEKYVPEIDPVTRRPTGDAKQFRKDGDRLIPLSRGEWVDDPIILQVGEMTVR